MFMAKQPVPNAAALSRAVQAGQPLSRQPCPLTQQTVTRPAIVPPQVEIASEPAVPVHALSSAPIQAKLGESKTERKAREAREADIQAAQNAAPGKGAAFGDMHQAHMQELAENQRHLRVYQVELQDRIDRGEIGLERDVSKLPGLFGGGGYDLERDRAGIQKRFDASPLANQVLFSRAFTSGAFRGFKAPKKPEGHITSLERTKLRSNRKRTPRISAAPTACCSTRPTILWTIRPAPTPFSRRTLRRVRSP